MISDDRELWRVNDGSRITSCVMRTCCAGAELQLLEEDQVILRELYPSKSDLYERARELAIAHRAVDIP